MHEMVRELFERQLRFAREMIAEESSWVVLDTSYILVQANVRQQPSVELWDSQAGASCRSVGRTQLDEWAAARGYERFVG